jgi:hypothetical protein
MAAASINYQSWLFILIDCLRQLAIALALAIAIALAIA